MRYHTQKMSPSTNRCSHNPDSEQLKLKLKLKQLKKDLPVYFGITLATIVLSICAVISGY